MHSRGCILVCALFFIPFTYKNIFPQEENADYGLSLSDLFNIETSVASTTPEKLADAPANVYVIQSGELRSRGYRTLQDLLEDLPGTVAQWRTGEVGTQIIVRGQVGNNRLKVLYNGMDIDPSCNMGTHWFQNFPIENIKQVEFLLGPYAARYGRNSFSGVLNVITKDPAVFDSLSVDASYGSYDKMQGTAVYGKDFGSAQLLCSMFGNYSEHGRDYTKEYPEVFSVANRIKAMDERGMGGSMQNAPYAERYEEPFDNIDGYMQLKIFDKLQLDLRLNQARFVVATGFYPPDIYTASRHNGLMSHERNFNSRLQYTEKIDFITSRTTVQYTYTEYMLKHQYLILSGYPKWYAQVSPVTLKPSENVDITLPCNNKLSLGASYEYIKGSNSIQYFQANKPTVDPDSIKESWYSNFTIQDVQKLGQWQVVLGAMAELSSRFNPTLMPNAAISYNVSDNSMLKLIYGSGYINPSNDWFSDQNADPSNPNFNIKGNPDIKPEKIQSLDFNFLHETERLRLNASLFANYVTDIGYLVSGDSALLARGYVSTYKNVGSRLAKGIDVNLNYKISEKLTSFLSYTFIYGKEKSPIDTSKETLDAQAQLLDSNTQVHYFLPITPKHTLKIGYNFILFNLFDVYMHALWTSNAPPWYGSMVDPKDTSETPGYTVMDVNLSTTPALWKNVRLSFGINNLFNEKILEPLSMSNSFCVRQLRPLRTFELKAGVNF